MQQLAEAILQGEEGVGWMLDAGCWILDAGCWIQDAGCWIQDAGCWILDSANLEPETWSMKSRLGGISLRSACNLF